MSILTTADRFRFELERLISSEIERLKDDLSLGFLDDYAQYKNVAGKIAGLTMALSLLDDAESRCNGEGVDR